MQTLLTKGKIKVKGLYSEKKNKIYDATILFGEDWTDAQGNAHIGFTMEFDKGSPQKEKKGGK